MSDIKIIKKLLDNFIHNFENLRRHKVITSEQIKTNTDLLWIIER
jgi:hypothetical protein